MTRTESVIGRDAAEMWLRPVVPLLIENDVLKLEIPNQLLCQTIKERYEQTLLSALREKRGPSASIQYTLSMGVSAAPEQPRIAASPVSKPQQIFANRLNPSYIFETFIEGPSNRFAYKAAQAVVKKLGDRANNPLIIHSNPGLGKTHLLHALGNDILKNFAGAKVLYMSGEEFVNEYIESLQNKTSESFRNKYRSLDCFLVDDIQFVAGKEASESEFFYTFNALFDSKKQIVLTSDRTPNELSIDQRLASRLLSGIVAEIKPPDIETRIAILRKKRELNKFNIPDDVIVFIATGVKASIREMEGCLYTLNNYCSFHNVQATVEIAKEVLVNVISLHDGPVSVNLETIKKIVAKHYSIDVVDFKSQRRTEAISFPRQIAMYLANELTELSLPEIGRAFDKDHSTVVHARDKIKHLLETDPFFMEKMNHLIAEVKSVDNQ